MYSIYFIYTVLDRLTGCRKYVQGRQICIDVVQSAWDGLGRERRLKKALFLPNCMQLDAENVLFQQSAFKTSWLLLSDFTTSSDYLMEQPLSVLTIF